MTRQQDQQQMLENYEPNFFETLWGTILFMKYALKEYNGTCDMSLQSLEMYTSYRLPTPNPDEPFKDEFPSEDENPRLVEMQEIDLAVTLVRKVTRPIGLVLAIAAIFLIAIASIPIWLRIVGVIAVLVVTVMWLSRMGTKMLKWQERYDFVASLTIPEPDSEDNYAPWNFMRWQKWALARYDFESRDVLFAFMSKKLFTVMKSGPMDGLIISNATGEEWPLRPEPAEAS